MKIAMQGKSSTKISVWPGAGLMKVAGISKGKKHTPIHRYAQRDMQAWEALRGIWQDKKVSDVAQWQRKIRKEWNRKLPKF